MSEEFKVGDKVFYESGRKAEVVGTPKLYAPIRLEEKKRPAILVPVAELVHQGPEPDLHVPPVKALIPHDMLCNSCESRAATKRIMQIGTKCALFLDSETSQQPGYLICDECFTPSTCDCVIGTLTWVAPVADAPEHTIDVFSDGHSHHYASSASYSSLQERLQRAETFLVEHISDILLDKFALENGFVVEWTKMGRRTLVPRKP